MAFISNTTLLLTFAFVLSMFSTPATLTHAGHLGEGSTDPFSYEYMQQQKAARAERDAQDQAREQQANSDRLRSQERLNRWENDGVAAPCWPCGLTC